MSVTSHFISPLTISNTPPTAPPNTTFRPSPRHPSLSAHGQPALLSSRPVLTYSPKRSPRRSPCTGLLDWPPACLLTQLLHPYPPSPCQPQPHALHTAPLQRPQHHLVVLGLVVKVPAPHRPRRPMHILCQKLQPCLPSSSHHPHPHPNHNPRPRHIQIPRGYVYSYHTTLGLTHAQRIDFTGSTHTKPIIHVTSQGRLDQPGFSVLSRLSLLSKQPCSPKLSLSHLLHMHCIGSLVLFSVSYTRSLVWTTHIGNSERSHSCPPLSQFLVLRQPLSSKALYRSVNHPQRHGRHNKLHFLSIPTISSHLQPTLAIPISFSAPLAWYLSIWPTTISTSPPLDLIYPSTHLKCCTVNQ